MDQQTHQPPPTLEVALPRAHVLSYLAAPSTPTRVRAIAAGALRIIGFLTAIAALFLLALCILAYPRILEPFGWHWWEYPRELLSYLYIRPMIYLPLLIFPLAMSCSIIMLLGAKSVQRGRPTACIFAFLALALVTFLVALVTAAVAAGAIFHGLGIGSLGGRMAINPHNLLWLFTLLGLVPLVGLLVDVCTFLLWIARHPVDEKPPTSFLPR